MRTLRASHPAQAGKVPDAAVGDCVDLVALGQVTELQSQGRHVVTVDGLELLVIFGRRRFTVIENRCPHLGSRLDGARIGRRVLTCPVHSFRYSLADGARLPGPRRGTGLAGSLALFPTHIVDGLLYAGVRRARTAD
jgi:nitrite reductase/ring-hydroxylating ferredoxin subunit